MVKHIPVGKLGYAEVKRFEVDEQIYSSMLIRAAASRGREPATPVGTYTQLFVQNQLVMSDTSLEKDTNREIVYQAHGDVLIAGLGLGFILIPILAKEIVSSVTVVEKHQDVIDLIGPHLIQNQKLRLVHGDIFKYKPNQIYDTIYFDIWPDICKDNLVEMKKLERKFKKYLQKPVGWIGSWAKIRCQRSF